MTIVPDLHDDDPDDFQRGCYGPDMVDWQPTTPEPVTAEGAALSSPVDALRAAYWHLRGHASSYRGTDVFKRRQVAFRAQPDNPVLARGAMRDEWYARGIEAAADDIAEIITLDYEADVDPEPTVTAPNPPGVSNA